MFSQDNNPPVTEIPKVEFAPMQNPYDGKPDLKMLMDYVNDG